MSRPPIPETLFDWTPTDVDRPPTFAAKPLLAIRVVGTARPKGSLKPFIAPGGQPRVREQLAGSPQWRNAVTDAAHRAILVGGTCADRARLRDGYPHDGPVCVAIGFTFTPPRKRTWPWPATRSTGDLDKLARNILDSIKDAGVITDDSRVVRLVVEKRYATNGVAAAGIVVWPAAAPSIEESGTGSRDAWTPAPGAGAEVILTYEVHRWQGHGVMSIVDEVMLLAPEDTPTAEG